MCVNLNNVSVVVIGLNEELNLSDTFNAIYNQNYPVEKIEIIYVDSGSDDASVEIAKKYTDNIFIEDHLPSPARNRNRGLIEAKHEIVHFIDGDIQIDPDYLRLAIKKILEDNIHAVYGYLEELSKDGLNKILLSHWKGKKEGYTLSPGAGGTFIRENLLTVHGYDERIVRGEETELGERFRKAGYNIYFINRKMGTHNYDVHNYYDYLKLIFVDGKSRTINYIIGTDGEFFKNNIISLVKLILQNIILLAIFLFSIFLNNYYLLLISFCIYIFYLILKYIIIRKIRNIETLIYFFLMNISKPVAFAGVVNAFIKYLFNKDLIKPKMKLTI